MVAERPDRTALVEHHGQPFTYAELDTAVSHAERTLSEVGTRAGDRVLIVGDNCVATAAFIFACSRLDAWFVPVSPRLAEAELDRLRTHATPRVIVFATTTSAAVAEIEAALNQHPAVSISAAVGRDVDGVDEQIIAFVVLAETGATDEPALKAFLDDKLATYKHPL